MVLKTIFPDCGVRASLMLFFLFFSYFFVFGFPELCTTNTSDYFPAWTYRMKEISALSCHYRQLQEEDMDTVDELQPRTKKQLLEVPVKQEVFTPQVSMFSCVPN